MIVPQPWSAWDAAPVLTALLFALRMRTEEAQTNDHIHRGKPSRPADARPRLALSIVLRLLDPMCLAWLFGAFDAAPATTARECLLIALVFLAALKQSAWLCLLNREEWTWDLAVGVAVYNNWADWVHAQCLLCRRPASLDAAAAAGAVLVVFGLAIEFGSEWQRHVYKSDPKNGGKVYAGGLFRWARHVNYTGYVMWRTGLGLVSGPPFTLAMGMAHAIDFYYRAVPLLRKYMSKKYGAQWARYEESTPWAMIPGII